MSDTITVKRVIEFTGPKEAVEKQVIHCIADGIYNMYSKVQITIKTIESDTEVKGIATLPTVDHPIPTAMTKL